MQRGDAAVFSISAALAAVVVAAVAFSALVLDRESTTLVSRSATSSLLVVTWGPSFCAVEPSNPACGEIRAMGKTLVLHGLWPQPPEDQYCGVSLSLADRARRGQGGLPPVTLSDTVRSQLQSTMADSAKLVPHEWYAHGTCSGVTPDEYFGDAGALTAQVQAVLDPVFAQAAGGELTLSVVRARISDQFGPGTGERIGLSCRKGSGEHTLAVDVRLSLPPVAAMPARGAAPKLGELLADAPVIDTQCHQGRVV